MNIGQLTLRANGILAGRIDSLMVSMTIALAAVNSDNERAPKFDIMAKAKNGAWVRVGALFEQTTRSSGEVFYQGQIEDPSLDKGLPIALFRADLEDGTKAYNIAWTRRRPRQELAGSRVPSEASDLGESTVDNGTQDDEAHLAAMTGASAGRGRKAKAETSDPFAMAGA